jgi:methyl-accepting chemotaxis protein
MLDRLLMPVVADEEIVAKAQALNLLALVTAVIIAVYAVLMMIIAPGQVTGVAAIALGITFVLSLGCFWLARQGRVQLAGYLLFVGMFVAVSLNMLNPNSTVSDLTMAPFLYVIVILPAGYVLHPRVSFVAATLAVAYTVGLLLIWPPPAYAAIENPDNLWSNIALAFALFYILSAVVWIFSRGIDRALDRARQQNRELKHAAQELEEKRLLQANMGRQILELAERVTQYSTSQARGSSRQAAAIAQVSTSIEELKQSAGEIAQNARIVDQAAQQTLRGAQQGQNAVLMSNEAMAIIHVKALEGAKEAGLLGEHLEQTERVAAIISNLASQIQMVAFNATLEAAEAGEAGHRFSVVAAEVKDLASDSLKQAKQVADTISQVQNVGETSVALSEEQVQAVRSGSELMNRSNAANQAIIESATQMADQARQIQQTTEQQQHASEQVATSVQEIRTVVDRWVVSSYQMDEMVASLHSLAEQLA